MSHSLFLASSACTSFFSAYLSTGQTNLPVQACSHEPPTWSNEQRHSATIWAASASLRLPSEFSILGSPFFIAWLDELTSSSFDFLRFEWLGHWNDNMNYDNDDWNQSCVCIRAGSMRGARGNCAPCPSKNIKKRRFYS